MTDDKPGNDRRRIALLAFFAQALSRRRALSIAGTLWAVFPLVILFGPPDLYEYAQSPAFCAACHVMHPQRDTWMRMGKHRETGCLECHLPNHHWASRLLRMAIAGSAGTAAFVSGSFRDPIRLSDRGRLTVQSNCVRCHEAMVSRIGAARACWDCHRRSTHTGVARIVTR